MKFDLIDDAQNFLKFWSTRFNLIALALLMLDILVQFGTILPFLDGMIPKWLLLTLSVVSLIAGLISRVLVQNNLRTPIPESPQLQLVKEPADVPK